MKDFMSKVKKIAKYTTNVLNIVIFLINGINAVEGITIPYAYQITEVLLVIQAAIATYLLTSKKSSSN